MGISDPLKRISLQDKILLAVILLFYMLYCIPWFIFAFLKFPLPFSIKGFSILNSLDIAILFFPNFSGILMFFFFTYGLIVIAASLFLIFSSQSKLVKLMSIIALPMPTMNLLMFVFLSSIPLR